MSSVYLIAVGLLIICSGHEAAGNESDDEVVIFETNSSNVSHFLSQTERQPLDTSLCTENITECAPVRSCFTAQQEIELITYPTICGWDIDGQPFVCCPSEEVRYPSFTNSCPEHKPNCVNVTSCIPDHRNIQPKKNPTFCGWATADDPLVCCPDDMVESPLGPLVCGMRHTPGMLGSVPRQEEIIPDFELLANNTSDIKRESIIGGKDSVLGAWPWMAGIYRTDLRDTYCGATVISQYDLVTAAHCFNYSYEGIPPSIHYVLVGSIMSDEGAQHFIENITVHPDYRPGEIHDDIAVIRLKEPIRFRTNILPICLPTSSEMQEMELTGRNVTVVGWGFQDINGTTDTTILQEVTVQVMDPETCNMTYDQYLCASVPEGGKDACSGDSGGPLMLFENGTWVLFGVVSYGDKKCAEPGYPGIYTRVTTYMDWLQEVTA